MRSGIENSVTPPQAKSAGHYRQTTRSIRIEVEPLYLADQSEPDQGYYVWAYTVSIYNEGREAIQLFGERPLRTDRAIGRFQTVMAKCMK